MYKIYSFDRVVEMKDICKYSLKITQINVKSVSENILAMSFLT